MTRDALYNMTDHFTYEWKTIIITEIKIKRYRNVYVDHIQVYASTII